MQADRLVQRIVSLVDWLRLAFCSCVAERLSSSGPTTVSGTVTLDGQAACRCVRCTGNSYLSAAGGQGTMATGLLDSAGHFQLGDRRVRRIVAPGKYQVAVSVVQLLPKSEDDGAEAPSSLRRRSMRRRSESGLEADVVPGENEFSFDLVSNADNEGSRSPDRLLIRLDRAALSRQHAQRGVIERHSASDETMRSVT